MSAFPPRRGLCAGCNKITDVRICTRCRCTYYCGKDCQKASWPEHKKMCTPAVYPRDTRGRQRPPATTYAYANTPGKNILRLDVCEGYQHDKPLRILQLGFCDLRDFLLSIAGLDETQERIPEIEWHLVDLNYVVVRRGLLMLRMLQRMCADYAANNNTFTKAFEDRINDFVMIWYSHNISAEQLETAREILFDDLLKSDLGFPDKGSNAKQPHFTITPGAIRDEVYIGMTGDIKDAVEYDMECWEDCSGFTSWEMLLEKVHAFPEGFAVEGQYPCTDEIYIEALGSFAYTGHLINSMDERPSPAVFAAPNLTMLSCVDNCELQYLLPGIPLPYLGWNLGDMLRVPEVEKLPDKAKLADALKVYVGSLIKACVRTIVKHPRRLSTYVWLAHAESPIFTLKAMPERLRNKPFDRITTNNLPDVTGFDPLLDHHAPLLNADNRFATMIMDLQNWSHSLDPVYVNDIFKRFSGKTLPDKETMTKAWNTFLDLNFGQHKGVTHGNVRLRRPERHKFSPVWNDQSGKIDPTTFPENFLEWVVV